MMAQEDEDVRLQRRVKRDELGTAKPRKSRRRVTGKTARTSRPVDATPREEAPREELPREEIASAPPVIEELLFDKPPAVDTARSALHERRVKLAKYVKTAVALSAALCLVAGVRGAIAHATRDAEAMTRAVASDVSHAASRVEPRAEVAPEPI